MYSFPDGEGAAGQAINSGKHHWLPHLNLQLLAPDYCIRAFLAQSVGFRIVVLVPFESGVLELGLVNAIPESFEALQRISYVFSQNQARLPHQQQHWGEERWHCPSFPFWFRHQRCRGVPKDFGEGSEQWVTSVQ